MLLYQPQHIQYPGFLFYLFFISPVFIQSLWVLFHILKKCLYFGLWKEWLRFRYERFSNDGSFTLLCSFCSHEQTVPGFSFIKNILEVEWTTQSKQNCRNEKIMVWVRAIALITFNYFIAEKIHTKFYD